MQASEDRADRYIADQIARHDGSPPDAQGECAGEPMHASGHRSDDVETHTEGVETPLGEAPDEDTPPFPDPQQQQQQQPEEGERQQQYEGMDIDIIDDDLRYVLSLGESDPGERARRRHREIIEVANALGTCGKSYRLETVARLRATVSEVDSAPTVTAAAQRHMR